MIDRISELRSEIALSIKSVRLACFGRKCLKACQRRIAAAAPHPRATRRRWGAAVAAVLLCFGAFVLEGADVQCIWNGSTYVCSGTGSSIEVIGGGGGGPVVVTNVWGSCTNCVLMTPEYCETMKSDIDLSLGDLAAVLYDAFWSADDIVSSIDYYVEDIDTFQRFGYDPAQGSSVEAWQAFSNYIHTVENTQTSLCLAKIPVGNSLVNRRAGLSYNNGIYDYAQTLKDGFEARRAWALDVKATIGRADERIGILQDAVADKIICEQCEAGDGKDPPGGGSGSGIATNGNWCTYDQGEAIKDLLRDLKDWAERQHSQLVSISNFVEQSYNTLRDGLFTDYTHIPTEEDLGMHWQELYLEGYSPNFHEYASTNILARIELLLAGMSGVLTNNSDYAAAGSFAGEGMEPTNDLKIVVGDFTNEFVNVVQAREQDVRSVGDALVGLYNAFRGWSGTPFSRTTLIESYSVEIGENHWDVPTFEPSEKGLWVGNMVRVVCRSVMSVIYILFSVAVLVRFSMAYFEWVWKYVKWGVELMQGLFA